jgi:hypothetical protein
VPHRYGVHGVLDDQGQVMARLREEVSARMLSPQERENLKLPPGVPVLDVWHTSLDAQGRAHELTHFVMRRHERAPLRRPRRITDAARQPAPTHRAGSVLGLQLPLDQDRPPGADPSYRDGRSGTAITNVVDVHEMIDKMLWVFMSESLPENPRP